MLFGRGDFAEAGAERGAIGDAGLGAAAAGADAFGVGGAGVAWARGAGLAGAGAGGDVIDGAVAVIVDAVADLGAGERLAFAGSEGAAAAGLASHRAGADPGGGFGAVVAVAGERGAAVAFVGDAIAVVVEAVADLGAGGRRREADDLAVDAGGEPGGADARLAGGAGLVDRRVFVGGAIAVIVSPVAGFGGRVAGFGVAERAVAGGVAGVDAIGEARAFADAAWLAEPGEAFVGGAIAVIVDGIASLGGGHAVAGHAGGACLRADAAAGRGAGLGGAFFAVRRRVGAGVGAGVRRGVGAGVGCGVGPGVGHGIDGRWLGVACDISVVAAGERQQREGPQELRTHGKHSDGEGCVAQPDGMGVHRTHDLIALRGSRRWRRLARS